MLYTNINSNDPPDLISRGKLHLAAMKFSRHSYKTHKLNWSC